MPSLKEKVLERLGVGEVTDKTGILWKAVFAEFMGNVLLNFFGCASCIFISDPHAIVGSTNIAITFGFVVFALVLALGHISGGHFNPAVSIACVLVGKITIIRAILYLIVQCAGSIAGSGLLKALTPNEVRIQENLGLNMLNPKLSPFQGACIEMLLGFFLVFVVFAVTDPNRYFIFVMAPVGVGLTVTAGHLAALDYTGAAMNPARALGAAVIVNQYNHHWIYWLGPITGGILAGLLYHFFLSAPPSDDEYDLVSPDDKKGQA